MQTLARVVLGGVVAFSVGCGAPCPDARCSNRPTETTKRLQQNDTPAPAENAGSAAVAAPAGETPQESAAPATPTATGNALDMTTAADSGQIELRPPDEVRIDIVKLVAPEIDASASLGVEVVDAPWASGKGLQRTYTFTNRGSKEVSVWKWSFQRGRTGEPGFPRGGFAYQDELAHLKPGERTSASLGYGSRDGKGLTGEYRLVYVCFDRAAGDRVNAVLDAFNKRLDEAVRPW